MLLALGLNIVVGWGGLLDLGFVAFFGVGAYAYALLSSDQYDIHLPTLVVIPLVAVIGGLVGWLVGLPSRRLTGDYLAIVTLFFFQVFLTATNNGDDVFGESITNGPNGILDVDEFGFFGWELPRSTSEGLFTVELPLRRARLLRPRVRRAPPPERLAHGARLALAPRGSARGRADGDAGQPAEADGVRVRRGRRRPDGHVRDRAQRERLPAELRVPAPDHRLHDGDPRRRRQPGGRRARRGDRQRPARGAARAGRRARSLLRRDRPRARRRRSAPRWKLVVVLGGTIVFGVVARLVAGAIDDAWTAARSRRAGGWRRGPPTG